MKKKYHIKTWGCQMNVYDSQRIAEVLQSLNYEQTDDLSDSDIVILNTCHIREKATEKVYSDIGRLKVLKDRRKQVGKNLIIGVSGCVAQAEGDEIIKRAPVVDLVFGPQTWHRLKDMLLQIENENKKVCDTDFPTEVKFDHLPEVFDKNRIQAGSAFIAVQEGCDKFCTYCVVPYTRGAEYSRPTWQVIEEVSKLVKEGAKEITLLGQNVNAYHGQSPDGSEWSLGRLIRRLAEIDGLKRIRYTTSYPAEVDDDLINAHKDVDKLMPFLHLPIQSGSNSILKAMNRRHTTEEYLKLLEKLKNANPNLAFSSDFIVGFPGETDQDFQDTLDIVDKVGFIQAYSFAYSPRPGTPAAVLEKQIDDKVKQERLQILQHLLANKQRIFNENSVGSVYDVLLDRVGKKENQLVGKSPYMQAVIVDNADKNLLGKIVSLKITDGHQNSLLGHIV
jgi:tRNA-2-methylthio-N6-dimethylallyladenosine synthase